MGAPRKEKRPAPKERATILLIEDEGTTALLLLHILKREGYDVVLARDGRAAVQAVAQGPPPRLVVTDMMLPYVDGYEVIRQMRERREWDAVPILVVTSKSQEKDVVRVLDLGADDYICKPFRPEELLARVRRCLRAPR